MSIGLLEMMVVTVIGIMMLAGPLAAVALVVALSQRQPSADGVKNAIQRSSRTALALCGVAVLIPVGLVGTSGLVYLLRQGHVRLPEIDLAMLSGFVIIGLVVLLFGAIIAGLIELVQRERRAAGKPELTRGYIAKWTAIAMIPVTICVAAAVAPTATVVQVSRGTHENSPAAAKTAVATHTVATNTAQRTTLEPPSSPVSRRGISMPGLGVFEILILAMAGFGIYRWTSGTGRQSGEQSGRNKIFLSSRTLIGGALLVVIGFLLIPSFSYSLHKISQHQRTSRQVKLERDRERFQLRSFIEGKQTSIASSSGNESPEAASALNVENTALPQSDRSLTVEKLPDWITAGNSLVSGGRVLVISSQQYATAEEATADAQRQVLDLLGKDLALYQPNRFGLRRSVADSVGTGSVIKNTYLQTVQRDFGSFFAPMHRMWYQVELSPQTREAYLLAARDQAGPAHLGIVLAGFLSLLLAPVGIVVAGVLTRISSSGENSRPLWYGIIGGLVVGLWLVIAQVLNRFVVLW